MRGVDSQEGPDQEVPPKGESRDANWVEISATAYFNLGISRVTY